MLLVQGIPTEVKAYGCVEMTEDMVRVSACRLIHFKDCESDFNRAPCICFVTLRVAPSTETSMFGVIRKLGQRPL